MPSRPYTFDRVIRWLIALAGLICFVWLVNYLKDVLLPFCAACLIAYILEPIVEMTQRVLRFKHRAIPVFITLFEVALVIGLLIYFFAPSVEKEIDELKTMIATYSASGTTVPHIPGQFHDFISRHITTDSLNELLENGHIETLLNKGTSVISGVLTFLLHTLEWLLTFIYVIFILLDYKPLMRGFRLLVPPKYRKVAYRVGDDIKTNMNRYFRGQVVIAACAAVFYCIGFSIVGLPMAIVLGITVGVLYMIPYFQYVTVIPVALLCFISSLGGGVEFWPILGKCALVYLVSQCICDYVLTPKIMGKALGINPAIILLSLSVWGTLLGLIGMIIALPLTTLLLAYYQQYIINRSDVPPAEKDEADSTFRSIAGPPGND